MIGEKFKTCKIGEIQNIIKNLNFEEKIPLNNNKLYYTTTSLYNNYVNDNNDGKNKKNEKKPKDFYTSDEGHDSYNKKLNELGNYTFEYGPSLLRSICRREQEKILTSKIIRNTDSKRIDHYILHIYNLIYEYCNKDREGVHIGHMGKYYNDESKKIIDKIEQAFRNILIKLN